MIGLPSSLIVVCFLAGCRTQLENAALTYRFAATTRHPNTCPRLLAPGPFDNDNRKEDKETNLKSEISSPSSQNQARVRFSALGSMAVDESNNSNRVDDFLSLLTSDVGSIAFGMIGLLVLLASRLFLGFSDDITVAGTNVIDTAALEHETRSNLLALLACGAVLVNGISKLDVESVLAETVELDGVQYKTTLRKRVDGSPTGGTALQWALEALLKATPASSVVLLQVPASDGDDNVWQITGYTGILPANEDALQAPSKTPILDRFRGIDKELRAESYLPTLQNLPGRTEFTYLPSNTQAVLLVPAGTTGMVVVLGSNQARSFTPRDIAWCQAIASRLADDDAIIIR
jgi:hypothetical protein